MRRVARTIYIVAAWLALVGVVLAIFMAGLALFVDRPYWQTHMDFGWGSELPLLVLILAGLAGWIPRRLAAWLVALLVLHFIQTSLPTLKNDAPLIAAVHPLNASLLAWLSLVHARKAQQLLLGPGEAPVPIEPEVISPIASGGASAEPTEANPA